MNREAWWATVHGVTKSQTQLTYFLGLDESVKLQLVSLKEEGGARALSLPAM